MRVDTPGVRFGSKADIAGIKVVPEIRKRSRVTEVSGSRVARFDARGV